MVLLSESLEHIGPKRTRVIMHMRCDVCAVDFSVVRKRLKDALRSTCSKSCATKLHIKKNPDVSIDCTSCGKTFIASYIDRAREYCYDGCARESINGLRKSEAYEKKQCLTCKNDFTSRKLLNRMYCSRECSYEHRSHKRVQNVCRQCGATFSVIKSRKSAKFCGSTCQNASYRGPGNPYYGKKHSPKTRTALSISAQQAWERGDFNNVIFTNVRWYDYIDSLGRSNHVQGTWELGFIKFLDANGYVFETHPKPLVWFDTKGKQRLYFPDFFVKNWKGRDSFVDTKNEFVLSHSLEKFECIRRSNESVNIVIIREHELKELGVL